MDGAKISTFRMSGSALFELGSGDLAAWQIRWCCKVGTKPVQFYVRFLTKKGFITTVLSGHRHRRKNSTKITKQCVSSHFVVVPCWQPLALAAASVLAAKGPLKGLTRGPKWST